MNEEITYDRMKGAIGSLLFLWADIEQTVRTELSNLYDGKIPKSAHGVAAALNAWNAAMCKDADTRPFQALLALSVRADLQRPLEIRNGICHGLSGVSCSNTSRPATITWRVGEAQTSITWDELHSVFQRLSVAPRAISIVSNAAVERDDAKAASLLPDREWWKTEFAFDLPIVPVLQNYRSRGL